MRALFCGSRDWTRRGPIERAFNEWNITAVIEGGARGADDIASRIARERGIPVFTYRAEWERYGKRAGSLRNQRMLDEGKPDIVFAFPLPASIGTWDMVRRANAAGISTHVWTPRNRIEST